MKYLFTLTAYLLFFVCTINSQDLADSLEFSDDMSFDEDTDFESDGGLRNYNAFGVGYLGSFNMYNFDIINDQMNAIGFGDGFDTDAFKLGSPVFVHGAGAFSVVSWWVPNLRVGFYLTGGSAKKEQDLTIEDANYTRGIEFSINTNTVALDYGIVLFDHLALLPGASVNWGQLSYEAYQSAGEYNWNTDFNSDNIENTFFKTAECDFITVKPMLSFEYGIQETFTILKLNASYEIPLSQSWHFNRTTELSDPPEDFLGKGVFSIQFGIFFGLFDY